MGSGTWSTYDYQNQSKARSRAGKSAFDYTDQMRDKPAYQQKAHASVNPYGVKYRESCDSKEHPNSLAISVLFDVTGSQGIIPMTLQAKMPELFGLLLRKGYVADPQLMFGGIGDHTCDNVPLQAGQFESDNRTDESLRHIYIEGGGGGQRTESYELAMYFMARHTKIDCYRKRGHKGYLFMVVDELPHKVVSKAAISQYIGDKVNEDIPLSTIVQELTRMYEVYILFPTTGSQYSNDTVHHNTWKSLFPEHLVMFNPDDICEVIASIIGKREGAYEDAEILGHLMEFGVSARTVKSVGNALAVIKPGSGTAINSTGLPGINNATNSRFKKLK